MVVVEIQVVPELLKEYVDRILPAAIGQQSRKEILCEIPRPGAVEIRVQYVPDISLKKSSREAMIRMTRGGVAEERIGLRPDFLGWERKRTKNIVRKIQ